MRYFAVVYFQSCCEFCGRTATLISISSPDLCVGALTSYVKSSDGSTERTALEIWIEPPKFFANLGSGTSSRQASKRAKFVRTLVRITKQDGGRRCRCVWRHWLVERCEVAL